MLFDDGMYFDVLKTINSIKYFHPNFNIVKYGTSEIKRLKEKYQFDDSLWFSDSCLLDDYISRNPFPDILIKIGADCIVLDKLDEVITWDYDVACPRNDPDEVGDRDERLNRPDILRTLRNRFWVNADFIAIKNKDFIGAYHEQNMRYMRGEEYALKDFGKIYRGDSMSSLNVVFHLGRFKSKILDPHGSKIIYGGSGNWSKDGNNWWSWDDIHSDGGKSIMLDGGRGTGDRIVKCLHQGGAHKSDKLNFNLFNSKFRHHLKDVTGFAN
jgi:hypothetical protein